MHIVDASCKFAPRTWELSAVAYEKISVWLSLCMFYSFLFTFCCWNTVTSGQPLKSTHTHKITATLVQSNAVSAINAAFVKTGIFREALIQRYANDV